MLFIYIFVGLIALIGVSNYWIVRYGGTPVARPDIPREAEIYGSGKPLTYVVLGDSTTISQGGNYDNGYARESARFIAEQGRRVTLHNLGVSGAKAGDVLTTQIPQAVQLKPDIALIAVGANDVTGLTVASSYVQSLRASITALKDASPEVQIVITGSADMGSVPRFPWPTDLVAGYRTMHLNKAATKLAGDTKVIFAPIADKTGPVFAARPELFAADKFHPNTEGYKLWTKVINQALKPILN